VLVATFTVLVCVALAEAGMRIADGLPATSMILPESIGAIGVDTTSSHLDAVPRAPGVSRELYARQPPPLPNRTKPPEVEMELFRRVQKEALLGVAQGRNPFQPWDIFKAWNAAFVGDPCKHAYLSGAPGLLYAYDPLDGGERPRFRFLPDTTLPSGLVTNAFGWRGSPVEFRRTPRTVRIVFIGASAMAEIHHYPFSTPEHIHHWLNLWAAERKLDVRFEVMNAARESIGSTDIAAIIRQEVAPVRPDLVVYYEGGNQFDMRTVVKDPPKGTPRPSGLLAGWLRDLAPYSAIARRAEALVGGGEWPKPAYTLELPAGVSESDPDIARPDLPLNLPTILKDLDQIRGDLARVDAELAVASFHWLAKDGLELDAVRHKPILQTLNVNHFPYTYRDLERMTSFENRVFAKYAAAHGLPFIDVAKHMPYDPDLFSDPVHNTPAGVQLRAWIMLQQLVPLIEKRLASGAWPKPPPEMPATHPAFTTPPRQITFACKSS
jgi:hypothetical protein